MIALGGITTPEIIPTPPPMEIDFVKIDRVINSESSSYTLEAELAPGVVIPSNTIGTVTNKDYVVEVCDDQPFLNLMATKKAKEVELKTDGKLHYGFITEYDITAGKGYFAISFSFTSLISFDIPDVDPIPTLPRL